MRISRLEEGLHRGTPYMEEGKGSSGERNDQGLADVPLGVNSENRGGNPLRRGGGEKNQKAGSAFVEKNECSRRKKGSEVSTGGGRPLIK